MKYSLAVAPKRPASFRIEDRLLDALQVIKDRDGIPVSEQVERALEVWIEAMGGRIGIAPGESGRTMRGERRRERLLEQTSGKGLVIHKDGGAEVGVRSYALSIWQTMHIAEAMGGHVSEIEGLKSVNGTVQFTDAERFKLVGVPLELKLEDGRRFPFFLQSSSGTIAAMGALE